MAQGSSRPVPVRRGTPDVDLSSKTELVQSFMAGITTSTVSDHQVHLAKRCIEAIRSRSARYEVIPFHMILQWNQANNPRTIAGACEILLKYSMNLLIPRRPHVWRTIKKTGSLFRSRVDIMIGARDILKMIGYTEEDSSSLMFPEHVLEPDRNRLFTIAAELLMAKLEVEKMQSLVVTPSPQQSTPTPQESTSPEDQPPKTLQCNEPEDDESTTNIFMEQLRLLRERKRQIKEQLSQSAHPRQHDISDEVDRKLYEEAMQKGYIESALALLILLGIAGSGKSLFKRLALGQPVPNFSPSTPLAESAVRSMSMLASIEWEEVGPDKMLEMMAKTIKEGLPLENQQLESSFRDLQSDDATIPEFPGVALSENTQKSPIHSGKDVRSKIETRDPANEQFSRALSEVNLDLELLQTMNKSLPDQVKKLMDVNFIYLLDSGGQPPFREMLPHFVKRASAIVLLQKLNERLDSRPTIRYREQGTFDEGYTSQLTNEQILLQYAQAVQSHKSKVFVVGTHSDREDECRDETRKQKNEKLLLSFPQCLQKQAEYYNVGADEIIFPVNSTRQGKNSNETMETIKLFRKRVEKTCMGEKENIPLPWFAFEQLLQLVAHTMDRSVLSLKECCEAAEQKLHMCEATCIAALKYLSGLSLIFYNHEVLPNIVFPNAQVILTKLTELVHCNHILRTSSSTVPFCVQHDRRGRDFKEYGLVDAELLQKSYPSGYRSGLFSSQDLEHLLIAGKFNREQYFIASLLPEGGCCKILRGKSCASHFLLP